MLIFGLHSTSDDRLGWLMDLNPICHPSPVNGLKPHLPPLSSQKNEMLIFGLRSTSDERPGWLKDSNPICHPSPAKKMKCLFLDYIQLLITGRLVDGLESNLPPLSSQKKLNAHFWITFNF